MFCRNCGNQIDDMAAVCVKCGVPTGTGVNFCHNCGAPTAPNATFCTHCGTPLVKQAPAGQQKSKVAAGVLGILLGGLGIHNFYLGYTGKGLAQLLITLLTCGVGGVVSGIWGLVEGIMILTGSINTDANGFALKD